MAKRNKEQASWESLIEAVKAKDWPEEDKETFLAFCLQMRREKAAGNDVSLEISMERSGKARSERGAQVRLVRNKPTPPER